MQITIYASHFLTTTFPLISVENGLASSLEIIINYLEISRFAICALKPTSLSIVCFFI
jgi:hypothetical protein